MVFCSLHHLVRQKTRERRLRQRRTCKHCDLVNVGEEAVAFTLEAGPQICNENLRTFMEVNCLIFEVMGVIETWKFLGKKIYDNSCRAICFLQKIDKASIKLL